MMYRYFMYYCPMYSKELLKGTLQAIILKLLAEHGSMYGYEISQKVKELSSEKILLKDGSLYPALQKMLSDGLVDYREERIGKRVRKYYQLTSTGKVRQKDALQEIKEFIQTLDDLLSLKLTMS
ncbi:PadR family transcriptional regulator [Croceimicrobium sp.]|uniref:PadR family transcriptional regulator n=1 Tax=Croceimicrobium sp. TaxID=2828340 RepID=UPI003BACF543